MRASRALGDRARAQVEVATESEAVAAPPRAGREGRIGFGAFAACSRLGEGLAYAGARLPNGHDGALEFEEGNF